MIFRWQSKKPNENKDVQPDSKFDYQSVTCRFQVESGYDFEDKNSIQNVSMFSQDE